MSYKLAKWIENEFDRNAWFFGEFKGGLMASCDFIDFVLADNDFLKMDKNDLQYIRTVRKCYSNLKRLTNEMIKEIGEYKFAFTQLIGEDEFLENKQGYINKESEQAKEY
ncbi:hypothetical protein IJD34_01655 [bacterium]|nr:hypothetical protein [bacterium]